MYDDIEKENEFVDLSVVYSKVNWAISISEVLKETLGAEYVEDYILQSLESGADLDALLLAYHKLASKHNIKIPTTSAVEGGYLN